MKWKFRRMVDKFGLFLVGIKPVRWFFDQLIRFEEWGKSKPLIAQFCKHAGKLWRGFWIGYSSYYALYSAWHHTIWSMIWHIALVLLYIFVPDDWHKPDDRDGGDDKDGGPDPTPNGDAVDRWLKGQQKVGA